jgi:hypothetical protein
LELSYEETESQKCNNGFGQALQLKFAVTIVPKVTDLRKSKSFSRAFVQGKLTVQDAF